MSVSECKCYFMGKITHQIALLGCSFDYKSFLKWIKIDIQARIILREEEEEIVKTVNKWMRVDKTHFESEATLLHTYLNKNNPIKNIIVCKMCPMWWKDGKNVDQISLCKNVDLKCNHFINSIRLKWKLYFKWLIWCCLLRCDAITIYLSTISISIWPKLCAVHAALQ